MSALEECGARMLQWLRDLLYSIHCSCCSNDVQQLKLSMHDHMITIQQWSAMSAAPELTKFFPSPQM